MKINIITPINNIAYMKNAIFNFERQLHKDKRLILVCNGNLLSYTSTNKDIISLHIEDENIGKARNKALDFLKNGDFFANFDGDDDYDSYYLSELDEIIESNLHIKNIIIGKLDYKIKHKNDIYEIIGLKGNVIHGPTISSYVDNIRYPEISFSEDFSYVKEKIKKGATLIKSSFDHFLYNKNNIGASKSSLPQLLNQIKLNNTIQNNQIKIIKNGNLIWKTGDNYEINNISDLINI